jgi:DNA-binding NarL/FixJ family response regulator
MDAQRQIVVIAPEQMIGAFSVLIHSVPEQNVLASATRLEELLPRIGKIKPDVLLIYLVRENGTENGEPYSFEVIARVKKIWPETLCVTIVKYLSQVENVKNMGADLALVDGVSAEKLLTAIEGKVA